MAKDSYQDAQVTAEAPDKIRYKDGQQGLKGDVSYTESKPIQNPWSDPVAELGKIARKRKQK